MAGLSGADPRDLTVFGVKAGADSGVFDFSVAAIVAQIYWYVLRYQHMKEDAMLVEMPVSEGQSIKELRVKLNPNLHLHQKPANLISNWVCFLMTVASWYFVYSWIGWPF